MAHPDTRQQTRSKPFGFLIIGTAIGAMLGWIVAHVTLTSAPTAIGAIVGAFVGWLLERLDRRLTRRRTLFRLVCAAILLVVLFPLGAGPTGYAYGRGWIPRDLYWKVYWPIIDHTRGTPLASLFVHYTRWWIELADEHSRN